MFTQAIGKAVELLAEKKGLDYVAKALVAELDELSAEEAGQDTLKSGARSVPNQSIRPRQRQGSAGPRQQLRLGNLREPGSQSWPTTGPLAQEIARKFKIFAEPMSQKIEARGFSKLCKDCKFFDRGFSAVDCDLIFKRVLAGSGQRKMDQPKFEFALQLVADRKGMEASDVHAALINSTAFASEVVRTESARAESARLSTRAEALPLSSVEATNSVRAELSRHTGVPLC
jgi:hypothetical protein